MISIVALRYTCFGYVSRNHETTIQLFGLLVGLGFKMLCVTRPKSDPNPNDWPGRRP